MRRRTARLGVVLASVILPVVVAAGVASGARRSPVRPEIISTVQSDVSEPGVPSSCVAGTPGKKTDHRSDGNGSGGAALTSWQPTMSDDATAERPTAEACSGIRRP